LDFTPKRVGKDCPSNNDPTASVTFFLNHAREFATLEKILNPRPFFGAKHMLVQMNEGKKKTLIAFLCGLGIGGVAYGMATKNHPVFITGLVFAVAGYLLIRRRLKASIQKQRRNHHPP